MSQLVLIITPPRPLLKYSLHFLFRLPQDGIGRKAVSGCPYPVKGIIVGDGSGRGCWLLNANGHWVDTGNNKNNAYPSWANVDFDTGNTGDTGYRRGVSQYSLTEHHNSGGTSDMVRAWNILGSNYDTGTYATDTGKWELLDNQTGVSWSGGQSRTYTIAEADTGTPTPYRHVRLYGYETDNENEMRIGQWKAWETPAVASTQFWQSGGNLYFDAVSRGGLAKAVRAVTVDTGDAGVEHGLNIHVSRGPLSLRVGSTSEDDDLIGETILNTGYHNLAITPDNTFYISIQNDDDVVKIIETMSLSDTGTVEITTPWAASGLGDIRHDQSADVVFVDASGIKPYKIERRASGRSWSVVENSPYRGPFKSASTISAKLSLDAVRGNTTVRSDTPFFKASHVGALFSIIHEGQGGNYFLGAKEEHTDPIKVSGLSDTGIGGLGERTISWAITGTYVGTLQLERSFDGPDNGYLVVQAVSGSGSYQDEADNVEVWYRVRLSALTSGGPVVALTYEGGFREGIIRTTGFLDNQAMECEVLEPFSDTGGSENWAEGAWSDVQGYPTAVAFHEGPIIPRGGKLIFGGAFQTISQIFQI